MFTAIHIPEFPVAARQCHSPEQRQQPCVVVDGTPPHERVFARCDRAGQQGIAHGMSRVQAEAGFAARFHARQPAEEEAAYAQVLHLANRFSPRVQALAAPGNAYARQLQPAVVLLLDGSGTGRLFGSIEQYGQALHSELRGAGFFAGIASTPNAEAALLLARSTRGVVSADRHSVRQQLARLRTSLLPCGGNALAVLERWGIRTLGELAALPEAALVSRLGQAGRRLQLLARGEADHLLQPEEEEFVLTATTVLDAPLEVLESLLFVLSPMLEALLRKAGERAYAVRSLQLTLQLERGEPHSIGVRPATPTQSRDMLLKLLNLELQANPPAAGIVGVTLNADPAQPQTAQRGLFQAQFPESDKLDLLLARLRSIAGEGNVGAPLLQNSHREDAFTVSAFQPKPAATTAQEHLPLRLAVRVVRPPQAVRVTLRNDQPGRLVWQGARVDITSCAGPWHSSGSWWDGEAWDHDLWDVVTAEPPQALRLRQDHASSAWFVVGLYD